MLLQIATKDRVWLKRRLVLGAHSCIGGLRFEAAGGTMRRNFSSATVADLPLPASMRNSVKATLFQHVARDDGTAWSSQRSDKEARTALDASHLFDPLDDLYLCGETLYWPRLPDGVQPDADPFLLTSPEIDLLSKSIKENLLGTDHPVLNQAASYFFASADGGKKVRPVMVMLISRAIAETLSPSTTGQDSCLLSSPLSWQRDDLPDAQRRLAEISEMIHTASLFHDDVIDEAGTRRGKTTVHVEYGNKMAILAVADALNS